MTAFVRPQRALPSRLRYLRRQLARTWGRLALAQAGVLAPLHTFVAARSAQAHKPDYADLWYLWRTVQQRRPREVLEYGSGCSTFIIALALQRLGRGHLLTLESDPAWATATGEALPARVSWWCDVRTSALITTSYQGIPGFTYVARPAALVPDLLYLDGPGFTAAHARIKALGLYALDVLQLEPTLPVGCRLIIDGRQGQTAFLRQHLRRPWHYQASRTMTRHVFTLGEEQDHAL